MVYFDEALKKKKLIVSVSLIVTLLFAAGCYTVKTDTLLGKWRGQYGGISYSPGGVVSASRTTMSLYFHNDSTVDYRIVDPNCLPFSGRYYARQDTLFLFSDEGNAVYLFKMEGPTLSLQPIYDENPYRPECLRGPWSRIDRW